MEGNMASKGEKAKSKKTTEAKKMTENKSKKEENIIIVFEYSKEMYNEMLRKKEVIEKNTFPSNLNNLQILKFLKNSYLFLVNSP